MNKKTLTDDEKVYWLSIYDGDIEHVRLQQLLNIFKNNSRKFTVRRRYDDYINYEAILSNDTVTYILLSFGDIIRDGHQ